MPAQNLWRLVSLTPATVRPGSTARSKPPLRTSDCLFYGKGELGSFLLSEEGAYGTMDGWALCMGLTWHCWQKVPPTVWPPNQCPEHTGSLFCQPSPGIKKGFPGDRQGHLGVDSWHCPPRPWACGQAVPWAEWQEEGSVTGPSDRLKSGTRVRSAAAVQWLHWANLRGSRAPLPPPQAARL